MITARNWSCWRRHHEGMFASHRVGRRCPEAPPQDQRQTNARMSLAFFQQPDWDACIDDLPTCLDPGETAQNPSVTSKRYRMERFHNTIHNTVLDEST